MFAETHKTKNDKKMTIHEILEKYWSFKQFRTLQEDIINSVLEGNDTLALMPTGGGKSVCFQIPALSKKGVCIVICPLIALMKDQVEQLEKRGISAAYIASGMSHKSIDKTLDLAVNGQLKFLYVSPERLQTELMRERTKRMKVSLLAIDESHCISQWGYDFRPPYLQIADFRTLIPDITCIALTATATPKVSEDIQEKLSFKKNKKIFQKSFARENLSYSSILEEGKEQKLLKILKNIKGSAVVYLRSRIRVEKITKFLYENSISVDFYHAGLETDIRNKKQEKWIKGETSVIVATNAFGMGIDKPDVRVVVHLDLPDNLEAYYQEAGRAGRDEQKAYAVVLYTLKDLEDLRKKTWQSFPNIDTLKRVYQAIGNHCNLPIGYGEFDSYDFELPEFCNKFSIPMQDAFHSLKRLEEFGLLQFNESYFQPSKFMFILKDKNLYEFKLTTPTAQPIIEVLLRLYGGVTENNFVRIYESDIANHLKVSINQIKNQLMRLQDLNVITYQPQKNKAQIMLLTPRIAHENLPISLPKWETKKNNALDKIEAVINYVTQNLRCRTQILLDYFGEKYSFCGVCDNCIQRKKEIKKLAENNIDDFQKIKNTLISGALPIKILVEKLVINNINNQQEKYYIDFIRILLQNQVVSYQEDGRLKWNE